MNAPFDQVDATLNLLNVNMVNITKLTSTNYMTWSLQVHTLLDGYDLAGYIDGTKPAPAPTTTVNDEVTANPEFNKMAPSRSPSIQRSHWHPLPVYSGTGHQHQDHARCLEVAQCHLCNAKSWTHTTTPLATKTLYQRRQEY